ncbi:Uncharacterised protein [Bordetella pertussis]|nr:Uncharacterised protein [Bordetella pertussis]CFM39034.1 Uncharacterised protein [Bordetella pertussis]CFM50481.1 Uncharacterised protein [Bordetella pertussis]CFM71228.1 Uncharacterised protein [Bordetella pertussis]CFM91729.1 Uncharacterised protein [Bordetella pertussis]
MRSATAPAAVAGAWVCMNTVSSGVTDTWRARGWTETRMALPSSGRASASAMTSRLASDENGWAASRRRVIASA